MIQYLNSNFMYINIKEILIKHRGFYLDILQMFLFLKKSTNKQIYS